MPFFSTDALDDPLAYEVCPSWAGGQVSFVRANQLQQNQAEKIDNYFIHLTGILQKRRGTKNLKEDYVAGAANRIQGLFWWEISGDEKLIIFADGNAHEFDGTDYVPLFTAAIADQNEAISIVQLADDLYWTDSGAAGVRKWDGAVVSTAVASPAATILESYTNRLVAAGDPATPDTLHFSDFFSTGVWNVLNKIRVGGDGDPITAVKGWQDALIVIFKEHSTWVLDATPTTTVANMTLKNVHRTVGCLAKRTLAQVGQDLWFLSRSGVQSVARQVATSNNVIAVPVSQPMHDLIQMINWQYAYKSCAVFYNNAYILAVPIFPSQEPNLALVYFYLTNSWTTWSGFQATAFLEQPIAGRTRLIIGNAAGEVRQALDAAPEADTDLHTMLYLDGPGGLDFPVDLPATMPVNYVVATMRTRAMEFAETVNPKSGFYLEIEFFGHVGEVTINAILDGAAPTHIETFELSPQRIYLPLPLPTQLPGATWVRKRFPLHQLPPFREIQIEVIGTKGNLVLRNIVLSAFVDTIELTIEGPL